MADIVDKRGQRNNTQPPKPEPKQGLAELFKPRPQQYMPVLKALETIGLVPEVQTIKNNASNSDVTECLVIPLQELVYKEWQHMSGVKLPEGKDQ